MTDPVLPSDNQVGGWGEQLNAAIDSLRGRAYVLESARQALSDRYFSLNSTVAGKASIGDVEALRARIELLEEQAGIVPTGPSLPRISRVGNRLVTPDTGGVPASQRLFRFTGANIYWLGLDDNFAGGTPRYPTHSQIDAAVSGALFLGATVVRSHTLGFSFGDPGSKCLVTGYNQSTHTFAVNDAAWEPIDYAIRAFGNAGIRLQIPFTDQFGYYHGGKRDIVHYAVGQNGVTDVSPDRTLTASNNPAEKIAEQQFYNNAAARAIFKEWISLRLNHVNIYTGVAAKNDPTFFAFELGSELWDVPQVSYTGWTQEMAAYVKSLAPSSLVDFGGAAYGVPLAGHPGLTASSVDIVGVHPYTKNAQAQPIAIDLGQISNDVTSAAGAGKVFTIGEYPWSRSNRDAMFSYIEGNLDIAGDAFWSLIASGETHGGAYGSDDAALYYPTTDEIQRTFAVSQKLHANRM